MLEVDCADCARHAYAPAKALRAICSRRMQMRTTSFTKLCSLHAHLHYADVEQLHAELALISVLPIRAQSFDVRRQGSPLANRRRDHGRCERDLKVEDVKDNRVGKTSFLSPEKLKAHKCPEFHNCLTSAWVQEPRLKVLASGEVVVVGKVRDYFFEYAKAPLSNASVAFTGGCNVFM